MHAAHHPRCATQVDPQLRCSCERESHYDVNTSTNPDLWWPMLSVPEDRSDDGVWFVSTQAGDDHDHFFDTYGEASQVANDLNQPHPDPLSLSPHPNCKRPNCPEHEFPNVAQCDMCTRLRTDANEALRRSS